MTCWLKRICFGKILFGLQRGDSDGNTELYPLTDFKGLNRTSSLQKAYKFGNLIYN